MSESVAPQGYMPAQLYRTNSSYGSAAELAQLIQALLAAGIAPGEGGQAVATSPCSRKMIPLHAAFAAVMFRALSWNIPA